MKSLLKSKPFIIGIILLVLSIPKLMSILNTYLKYPFGTITLGVLLIISGIIMEVLKKLDNQ